MRWHLFTILVVCLLIQISSPLHAQSELSGEPPFTIAENEKYAAIDVIESAVKDIVFLVSLYDNASNNTHLIAQIRKDYFPLFDQKYIVRQVLTSRFNQLSKARREHLECLVGLSYLNFHMSTILQIPNAAESIRIGHPETITAQGFFRILDIPITTNSLDSNNSQITYRLLQIKKTSDWRIIDVRSGSDSLLSTIKLLLETKYNQAMQQGRDPYTHSVEALMNRNSTSMINANNWCQTETKNPSGSKHAVTKEPEKKKSNRQYKLNTTFNGKSKIVYLELTPDGRVLYQDDIILGNEDDLKRAAGRLDFRNLRLWSDAIVPYTIDESISDKKQVIQAIGEWEKQTPVRFIEASATSKNRLIFVDGDGCKSSLGMNGGTQFIVLNDRCSYGAVLHEIGHALGLIHEHSRVDRDSFITVNAENILQDKVKNFIKNPTDHPSSDDYCYGSIMHYSARAFSRSRTLKTIETKNRQRIGLRKQLAKCDIDRIQTLYKPLAANRSAVH